MGKHSAALDLARFLAFDGQDVDQISRALQLQFGLREREATRMALNVVAPARDEAVPGGPAFDLGSLPPPY